MRPACASLLCALLLTAAVTGAQPAAGPVGWQEHSKNDLRGWEQLLRKGARSLK
eukprot:gene1424-28212_t